MINLSLDLSGHHLLPCTPQRGVGLRVFFRRPSSTVQWLLARVGMSV